MHQSWAGRRVLVTGAGGFIGSHLVEALVREQAHVRGFFRYTSVGGTGLLERATADQVEQVFGDLRDPDAIRRAVAGCDTVLHLGAEIGIPFSYAAPRQVVETNVLGTLNVLTAAGDAGVEHVLAVSSSEVYGTPATLPISEAHPLAPQSPYAASKVGADMLAAAFHRSYRLPVGTVRPFNTYGPRQSSRAVIPVIVSQALAGEHVRLGSLDPVRDFTFVTDTVAGILAVAAWDGAPGQVVQLGTGESASVGDLVTLIGELTGRELRVELDEQRVRPADSEVMALVSDPARARQLGWQPLVPLREGLAETIAWIEAHPERYPRPGLYAV